MKKIAIFVSGTGTNMEAIIRAVEKKQLNCNVTLVISDNPQAKAIATAQAYGIPTFSFQPKEYEAKSEFEQEIVRELRNAEVEWLMLAGYMRLIGPTLLQEYPRKIVNIHPSLLPKYKGKQAIEQAMAAGEKEIGVSIHYVDEGMDTGDIIAQKKILLTGNETLADVENMIHQIEHQLYPETIGKIIDAKGNE